MEIENARVAGSLSRGASASAGSTKYLLTRRRNGAFWPLRIGQSPVERALPVFSSPETAQRYLLARGLGAGWGVRATCNGELASILSGMCRGTPTVVLDPPPDASPDAYSLELMPRGRFLEQLIGDARKPGAPVRGSSPAPRRMSV